MKTGSKIYIDTAPFIYYINHNDLYFSYIEKFFSDYEDAIFFTSLLSEMEYLVHPIRNKEPAKIQLFDRYVSILGIKICPVDKQTIYKAATIRSAYRSFKAIDALHLATASLANCDLFFTNDKQLAQFPEINCLLVDDLVKSGNKI